MWTIEGSVSLIIVNSQNEKHTNGKCISTACPNPPHPTPTPTPTPPLPYRSSPDSLLASLLWPVLMNVCLNRLYIHWRFPFSYRLVLPHYWKTKDERLQENVNVVRVCLTMSSTVVIAKEVAYASNIYIIKSDVLICHMLFLYCNSVMTSLYRLLS